jgi:arylsulfatase A-like enzyme
MSISNGVNILRYSLTVGFSMLLFAGGGLAAERRREAPMTGGRPDVLLVLTDQWNPRSLGYAGDRAVRTPNLDRLAEEGMAFEACYTACPVCMPSRCGLLSGLYPHNTHLWGNNSSYFLPPAQGTMFRDVQRAGYTTAQIGKLHWEGGTAWRQQFKSLADYYTALGLDTALDLPEPFATPQGKGPYQEHLRKIGRLDAYCRDMAARVEQGQYRAWPSVVDAEDYNDTFVAQAAIDFLQKQSPHKPFCLVVSFPGPHPPMDAPSRYATLIPPASIDLPPNVPEQMRYEGRTYDRAGLQEIRANYYGKMALIDDCLGRIATAIRDRGTWDKTLVIFTSDHGEMMGAHGHLSKGRFYEESARVPLVMRWPGHIASGRKTAALCQLFDIYPTIVEAIGGKVASGHFARSLLGVATGAEAEARDAVFAEIGHQQFLNYMVRTPRYAWWIHNGKQALYDMQADSYQLVNLIDSPAHHDVLAEIQRRHLEYFKTTQVNLSADYKPLLQRMSEQGGGKKNGLSQRLHEQFREAQELQKP